MKTGGSTAIYKSIVRSCELLAPLADTYPTADLRVLVLSDGQDNDRGPNASTALQALQCLCRVGAVCDCIIVGSSCDTDLLKIVTATNGKVS